MENNWKTYCLMSGIALIEEFSKPKECYKRIIKNDKVITYNGLRAIRLKVKSYDIIKTWWKITRKWEQEMNMNFLGRKSKNGPIPEKSSGQWLIFFTPLWIFQILKTTGELPSKYATECYMKTVKSITERKSGRPLKYIISKKEITIIEDKNS
ncbi:MAG: hypothetical protein KKI14_02800, partial [Nanoarchaeota archaeon]|nr:hypothetical protein [Nanoarchaeota archaeon]